MSETAAERVREAIAAGRPPDRKSLERAIRDCFGMSARQAKKFAAQGVRALGVDDDPGGIEERLSALERSLKV